MPALVPWFFFSEQRQLRHDEPDHLPQHRDQDLLSARDHSVRAGLRRACSTSSPRPALFALLMAYYRVPLDALGAAGAGDVRAARAVHDRRDAGRPRRSTCSIATSARSCRSRCSCGCTSRRSRIRWRRCRRAGGCCSSLNPLSGIVEGFRSALVFGREPDWPLSPSSATITLRCSSARSCCSRSIDRYFADVI